MGPTYAGILGSLTFATFVFRGVIQGSSMGQTTLVASIMLFVFAAIGYVVGQVATSVITDSVQLQMNQELEALGLLKEEAGQIDSSRN